MVGAGGEAEYDAAEEIVPDELPPGAVLHGTYRILRTVASGGLGKVYAARHERLEGKVAIKVLHGHFTRDVESWSRFRQEANVLAQLRHPHVVAVLDFNVLPGGVPYLVLELVEGIELRRYVLSEKGLPPAWVAHVVKQIARALHAAHVRGIVHRDLKPENVMLMAVDDVEREFVKVLDFGLSKVLPAAALTVPGSKRLMGTPEYMAPEQIENGPVDHRTDQFSLAALTFELLTGRPPFMDENNRLMVCTQVLTEPPPPLQALVDWPAADVQGVLERALAKRPENRFATTLDFACALEGGLARM